MINNNNFNNKKEKMYPLFTLAVFIALMPVAGRPKQIPKTTTLNDT